MTQCAAGAELVAVEKAIAEHHALVYRLAYRLLRNSTDAEDVTQSVFLLLLRSVPAFEQAKSARSWLAKMTVNQAISWMRAEDRRRRRERAWAESAPKPNPSPIPMNDEALKNALESLPDELRIPVILHYQEGFKYREIAAVCKCPAGTVAKRISTAKARLKAQLVKGGAVALAMGLEASLSVQAAISLPHGLAERLVATTTREAATLSRMAAGGSVSAGQTFLGKLGIALGCASLLVSLGWYGIHQTLGGGVPSATRESSSVAFSSPTAASHADEVEAFGYVAARAPDDRLAGAVEAGASANNDDVETVSGEINGPKVHGWVRDASGQPVPGARVAFVDSPAGAPIGESVLTDEAGHYELDWAKTQAPPNVAKWSGVESMALRRSLVEMDKLDLTEKVLQVERAELDARVWVPKLEAVAPEKISLGFDAFNSALLGEVAVQETTRYRSELHAKITTVDAGGSMLSGDGYFYVVDKPSSAPQCSSCHSGGGAALATSSGTETPCAARDATVLVRAAGDGFEPAFSAPLKLQSPAPVQIDLELKAARPISGFVVDESGRGIPDVAVNVSAYSSSATVVEESLATKSGDDGSFTLPSLPAGVYLLIAQSEGTLLPAEAVAQNGDTRVRLCLKPAGSVQVTVASLETDEPLAAYRVEAHDAMGVAATATTNESGVAVLNGLRGGRYLLNTFRDDSGSKYSRASTAVHVRAGSESSAKLAVGGRADIQGTVTGLGYESAPEGWVVQIVPQGGVRRATSERKHSAVDPEGRFAIKNIPPGEYWLILGRSQGGGAVAPLAVSSLVVAPSARVVRAEISATPVEPAFLEVTVSDDLGRAIDGAKVVLDFEDLAQQAVEGVTAADGRVELQALPARYTISVTAPGREPKAIRGFDALSGSRQKAQVVLAEKAQELALEAHFVADPKLSVRAPLSPRAFTDFLRRLGAVDARLSSELELGGVGQRLFAVPKDLMTASATLDALAKSAGLRWLVAGSGIVLERQE